MRSRSVGTSLPAASPGIPSGACVVKAASHMGPAAGWAPLPASTGGFQGGPTCTSRRAQFERALCGVPECAEELRRCVHAARAVGGEGMRVVLTVSPVRRWHKA